jgi:hypothetical protein
LISLLVERIYLDLDSTDLPLWRDQETKEQLELRNKLDGFLMSSLRQGHIGEIQVHEDHGDGIFTIVLYWYLKDGSAKFPPERKTAKDKILSRVDFQAHERRSPCVASHTFEQAYE